MIRNRSVVGSVGPLPLEPARRRRVHGSPDRASSICSRAISPGGNTRTSPKSKIGNRSSAGNTCDICSQLYSTCATYHRLFFLPRPSFSPRDPPVCANFQRTIASAQFPRRPASSDLIKNHGHRARPYGHAAVGHVRLVIPPLNPRVTSFHATAD